jgi:replicative DNA helicase
MNNDIIEAEHGLIGCILEDNSVIADVDVHPTEFLNRQAARIFAAAVDMIKRGEVVDIFTLADEMGRTSKQDWLPMLAGLVAGVVTTAHAAGYAEAIRRKHRERKAVAVANDLVERIQMYGLQAIDSAIVELMAMTTVKRQTIYTMREAAKQAIQLLDTINESGGLVGVTTGFADLDKMLGGYHKTDLIITGARPAMGKTAYLINQALSHGKPTGVITTEQPAVQIAMRALSIVGKIDSTKLRSADLDDHDYSSITAASVRLRDMQIFFDEQAQPSITDIQRQARRWRHEAGIEVLHVDYVQRIKATDMRAPKHERVEEVVVGLKCLAKELEIPVHALAQVNRSVESRPEKRPNMGDLKDSGAIEQEADVIAMLYRDEVYNPETMAKGVAEINIEKNRHGPIGLVKLAWDGSFMRFRDISTTWPNY